MTSSEELTRLLQLYREQGIPNNVSVESFAKEYGVDATVFYNWIRATSRQAVPVKIIHDGDADQAAAPEEPQAEHSQPEPQSQQWHRKKWKKPFNTPFNKQCKPSQPIAVATIELSDGTVISKPNLSHQELLQLVEKLEAVC